MGRGSERKVPHIGTETRSKLLREPSSVQDDGLQGCKLLLCGNKMRHVWCFACTARIRTG